MVVEQVVLPALGHNPVTDEGKEATCLESGTSDGEHCARCQEVLKEQVAIPAKGHTIVDVAATAATCTEVGLTAGRACEVCGEVFTKQEKIAALGHKPVTNAGKAATCLEAGWSEYTTCSREGCTYSTKETIAALGHNYVDDVCTRCGYEVPADHTHAYTNVEITEATCEEDGVKVYTCKCGATKEEAISAYGHAWNGGVVTKEASCGVQSEKTYTCANCGDTKVEKGGDALEHRYNSKTTNPTCTSSGETVYTCVLCGHSYTNVIAQLSHVYESAITTQPMCGESGVRTYTCLNCNHSYTEYIDPISHNYITVSSQPATCTKKGKTTQECSNCGDQISSEIPALGHSSNSKVVVIKEETCTTNGEVSYRCTRTNCTAIKRTEVVPALGHDMGDTEELEATCTTDGYYKSVCQRDGCDYEENLVYEATGHIFVDGTCSECGESITVSGLSMVNGAALNADNDRPQLQFRYTATTAAQNALADNQELGALIVESSAISSGVSATTDWSEEINGTYAGGSISGTTVSVILSNITYQQINTKFIAIPVVRTTLTNGDYEYQYSSDVATNYFSYGRSAAYIASAELNADRLGNITLSTAKKAKLQYIIRESVGLVKGEATPSYSDSNFYATDEDTYDVTGYETTDVTTTDVLIGKLMDRNGNYLSNSPDIAVHVTSSNPDLYNVTNAVIRNGKLYVDIYTSKAPSGYVFVTYYICGFLYTQTVNLTY